MLDLSISHDIVVKQHAGSIDIETQPGEFTDALSRLLGPARASCQFSFFILPKIKQLVQQIAPSPMDAGGNENPVKGRKIFEPVSLLILCQRMS